jgi:hypothetical protein
LQYAFGKRRIEQQQEDLRRVQHMFMFMTTTLNYMPPTQSASGTVQAPTGYLRGMLEHVPIKINVGNNADGPIYYEATIELKPAKSTQSKQKMSPRVDERKRQKEQLGNMRRSPYFSEYMLKPGALKHHMRLDEDSSRKEKSKVLQEVKVPSKERAAEEVEGLLSHVSLWITPVYLNWVLIHYSFSGSKKKRTSLKNSPFLQYRLQGRNHLSRQGRRSLFVIAAMVM